MTVTQIAFPDDVRTLSRLSRIDYTDTFVVDAKLGGTGEEVARAMLDDASLRTRTSLYLSWLALGLRLGPPVGPDRILGWRLNRLGPDTALLTARGRLGVSGELLFRAEADDRMLFATIVKLGNPVARQAWERITARHEHVVRALLTRAARRANV